MSERRDPVSRLLSLPRELIVQVLALLDPPDVEGFGALSRAAREIVSEENEAIHRLMIHLRGWNRECTNSTSGQRPGSFFDPRPDVKGDADFRRAIAAQNTLSITHVDNWRHFAAHLHHSKLKWARSHFYCDTLLKCPGIWRFKVDGANGLTAASTGTDGIVIFPMYGDLDARAEKIQYINAPLFAHIELSGDFLAFHGDDAIEVWRRVQAPQTEGLFAPHRTITVGHRMRAYKARAPDILIASGLGDYSVVDLDTGELRQTGQLGLSPDGYEHEVLYVEFDARRLYFCTSINLRIVSRDEANSALRVLRMPSMPSSAEEAMPWSPWTGCHVDLRGCFLVALCERDAEKGLIVILDLRNYSQIYLPIKPKPTQLSVEVRLRSDLLSSTEWPLRVLDQLRLGQLSVALRLRSAAGRLYRAAARPRADSTMHRASLSSLKPNCESSRRPQPDSGQSRIEQDSSAIFVTASDSAFNTNRRARLSFASRFADEMRATWARFRWTDGVNKNQVARVIAPRSDDSNVVDDHLDHLLKQQLRDNGNDAIWCAFF